MKVIDYQKVDITDDEFLYYQEIVKNLTDNNINGEIYFKGLFETDNNGFITIIKPTKTVPWVVLFFIQQVQISQRLRLFPILNNKINILEQKILKLEAKKGKK